MSTATACSVGHFNPDLFGTAASSCSLCPAGTWTETEGRTECRPCPFGSYCDGVSTTLGKCAVNTYTPDRGAISVDECLNCPDGFICDGSHATPCSPGEFWDSVDKTCQPCEAGKVCSRHGIVGEPDQPCSPGHYCGASADTSFALNDNGLDCIGNTCKCPEGTYSDATDNTVIGDCIDCPKGYFCPAATGGEHRRPLYCPRGYFCPAGTSESGKKNNPCQAGSYSNHTRLFEQAQCVDCPPGFICESGDQNAWLKLSVCPVGSFCPQATPDTSIPQCPDGTFMPYKGNTREGDCIPQCGKTKKSV